jgi:hypothetical protein
VFVVEKFTEQQHPQSGTPFLPSPIRADGQPQLVFLRSSRNLPVDGYKEDQHLVKVIENLATKYIVYTLPMSVDPAISRTIKVISDQHTEGQCTGVLTGAEVDIATNSCLGSSVGKIWWLAWLSNLQENTLINDN